MEPRVEIKEHMRGGKGHVIMKHLLGEKELNGKCRIYAEITLEPGCEIGYHEHHNESETYYIISGQGVYNLYSRRLRSRPGQHRNRKPGTDGFGDLRLISKRRLAIRK